MKSLQKIGLPLPVDPRKEVEARTETQVESSIVSEAT
jgi:hypothetical protein